MTDIALCPNCNSDKGFYIRGGKVICKTCGYEDRIHNKTMSLGDMFKTHPQALRLMRSC